MQYGPETIFMVDKAPVFHTGSGNTAGNTPMTRFRGPGFFLCFPQEGHFPFTALPNNGQRVGIGVLHQPGQGRFREILVLEVPVMAPGGVQTRILCQ